MIYSRISLTFFPYHPGIEELLMSRTNLVLKLLIVATSNLGMITTPVKTFDTLQYGIHVEK